MSPSIHATRVPDQQRAPGLSPADLNFVIIVLDDGGAEWFEWSGLAEPQTGFAVSPRLAELRQLGVTFTRAYACPICAPSRARLWSSQYGFDAGLAGNPVDSDDFAFGGGGAPIANWQNPPAITLRLWPRLLQLGIDGTDELPDPNGYTYAQAEFGKSHLHSNTGRETWPCDHGLNRYVGLQPNAGELPPGDPNRGHFHYPEITQVRGSAPTSKTFGAAGTWPAGGPYVAYDAAVTPNAAWDAYKNYRDAVEWIAERTTPFLAIVNFNPPHAPFEVPPFTAPDDVGHEAKGDSFDLVSPGTQAVLTELAGGGAAAGYVPPNEETDNFPRKLVFRANLEAIDTLIGKLWDRIEPVRRAKTVFLVIGDNGTVANCADAPYEGTHAKRTPYEQGARVPCVVWGPPSVIASPGRISDHLLHVVDFLPTVFELAGCDPALWNPGGERKVRGASFARVLREPGAPSARDFVYNEIFYPLTATLNGPVAINPAQWIKTFTDGTYKIIQRPRNGWEFYRVDATIQPESGVMGYFEKRVDDLYPLVGKPGEEFLTETFLALRGAMDDLIAS